MQVLAYFLVTFVIGWTDCGFSAERRSALIVYPQRAMIQTRRSLDAHSIKLVIFDLDGTLIDSRLDLVHSVNAALRHIGRAELPDAVIASYVGDGAPILIQRALGGEAVDEALVRQGLQFFLSYYREHKLDHTTVYAGVKEALAAVQTTSNGVPRKMAVLTNKPVVVKVRDQSREDVLQQLTLIKTRLDNLLDNVEPEKQNGLQGEIAEIKSAIRQIAEKCSQS